MNTNDGGGRKIKALSVRQPWASMIASGQKTIETRTWATTYRGPLLICSTQKPAIEPAGYAIAVADLWTVRPLELDDWQAAGFAGASECLRDGVFAWELVDIMQIDPFPVRGCQRLFNVPLQDEDGEFRVVHPDYGFDTREHRARLEGIRCCFECGRSVAIWEWSDSWVEGGDGREHHKTFSRTGCDHCVWCGTRAYLPTDGERIDYLNAEIVEKKEQGG
jgi:hypothetical protein